MPKYGKNSPHVCTLFAGHLYVKNPYYGLQHLLNKFAMPIFLHFFSMDEKVRQIENF